MTWFDCPPLICVTDGTFGDRITAHCGMMQGIIAVNHDLPAVILRVGSIDAVGVA